MRWCSDIGMFAIDRPTRSCVHASPFCKRTCYNKKLYRLYPAMRAFDERLEQEWQALTGSDVRAELDRKLTRQTKRIRLMTRGEAFATGVDVAKVKALCDANPQSDFWAPTRGWRDSEMMPWLGCLRDTTPNIRLMWSMDPSTTDEQWAMAKAKGYSTMFFGDDGMTVTPNGDRPFKCPKTWRHALGHCAKCRKGCFGKGRIDVHLKQH